MAITIEFPVLVNTASLRCAMGMFSQYSKRIPKFSEKIRPLIQNKLFQLSSNVINAFKTLKTDIANSVVTAVENDVPFCVGTMAWTAQLQLL